MSHLHIKLLEAIANNETGQAKSIIENGLDLNVPCDQGASPLYLAILSGNLSIVCLLLENGSDPNCLAQEPAAILYAEKPLDLALQARFLMNWDQYDPIARLLQEFGATDAEGEVESIADAESIKRRAKRWQSSKASRWLKIAEKIRRWYRRATAGDEQC